MATDELPSDLLQQARELSRDALVVPDSVEGLAHKLLQARHEGRPLRVKLGVDPTSAHLHLGHAVVGRALRRFMEHGHQVVILIGGFTARIGDPTGRNTTRPKLTADEVAQNATNFLAQLRRVLDVDKVEVVNNASWFDTMSLPELLELAGRLTVNQLLAKDDFRTRIANGDSLALHEFLYPALQGFDSVQVRADVELGGTDQRFNLLMARQIQPSFGQEPQVAMMLPILEGIDGKRKMSKSFGNAIALDDTADDIVAKCMRIPDDVVLKFFTLATNMTSDEVEAERAILASGGNPKDAKERLARRIATELQSADAAETAIAAWQKVHSLRELPDTMPERVQVEPISLVKLLVESGMAESNTKARRLITDGAVKLDGEKEVNVDRVLEPIVEGGALVVSVGRKKFLKLIGG
jgi:tyrosyl-tRNA synthetase